MNAEDLLEMVITNTQTGDNATVHMPDVGKYSSKSSCLMNIPALTSSTGNV
jgi:hypothetical protein